MRKKLFLAAAAVVSIFTLAACSAEEKDIATMDGGAITVADFYNQVKLTQKSQTDLRSMIIFEVFEEKYGKNITSKDVQDKFDEDKKSAKEQGQNFEDQLKQAGYTEESYKVFIRQNLAYQAGIEAHITISAKDLENAWSTYHPEVEVQMGQVKTEDEAKEIKKQLENGRDFTKVMKEIDNTAKKDNAKIKFDSQTETVPGEVKEAAFKLKEGEISDPIQATDTETNQLIFYIVKMINNPDKGDDMEPYKKELTKIAEATKKNDPGFVSNVVSDELTEANVKIKDDAFKDVLIGVTQTDQSKQSSEDKAVNESGTE